jgi:valyl-tRNA synthetase
MVIPPPNVTGALHLGHAINGTIQDILARYHRMRGDNTLWMPGIDHAGIATQAVVEKTIFEKEKKNRHDLGREELVRRIWAWKEQFGTRILNQLQSIGASCDWDRTRFTLDETCAKAVREAFFKMFKDGLIFRGKRLVNWDTHLQTAVADDEIYHENVKGEMTSIKYPVEGAADEFLVVATTRPETMLGDTAVAVHPDDERYKHLHGKFVVVPLVGRKIPVICDGQLVDPKFGTGVVKVTPAHDPNDYATGQRHKLEMINLLTADGKVNENGAGEFRGIKYSYVGLKFATVARQRVMADLEGLGLIVERKPHEHEVGHSDRSKTPIEPYLSDQWFVRMGDLEKQEAGSKKQEGIELANGTRASGLAQAAMDAVLDGRVKITPERYAKGYLDWLGQKRDWCISRQLWWGHRIPVWTINLNYSSSNVSSIEQMWEERRALMQKFEAALEGYFTAYGVRQSMFWFRDLDSMYVRLCSRDEKADAAIAQLNELNDAFEMKPVQPGKPLHVARMPQFPSDRAKDAAIALDELIIGPALQDPDVLDTWFSSALWPISTMGWPANGTSDKPEDQLLPYFYPTSVLSTAREILTLWVARMVMFGLYCRGDVPFKDVYIHAIIQDGDGRPMKKTLGNGVDPVDIVKSHGADALRFTLASMTTETQDIRMPVQLVCPHCHERVPNNVNGPVVMGCPKCKKKFTRPVQTAVATEEAPLAHSTSDRFDLGRNFANKIWNASRFILMNLGDGEEALRHKGTEALRAEALEDRWILSRLNSTILEVESGINGYRFAELAEALRSFFWTDLCDWYLEIAKARIKAGDENVRAILLHCLTTALKLLHPVMPFVTEELWSKLGEFNPEFKTQNSELLIKAAWPVVDKAAIDVAVEGQLALIQAVVSGIREMQNRYPAAKGKDVVLAPRDAATQDLIEKSRGVIEALAGAKIAENAPGAAKPENAAASVLPETQIFIGGVIDKGAEKVKLTKMKAEKEKLIASNEGKLANQAFVSKAPAKIVDGLKAQLAKLKEELAAIERNLKELE